jgi:hypothetical protein
VVYPSCKQNTMSQMVLQGELEVREVKEPECPPSAGLCFPENNRGPRMAGWQPCCHHQWNLTTLCTAEAWGTNSPMGQMYCFHSGYFTVIHCHPFSVSVAVFLTIVFAIGDWTHDERLLSALVYPIWAGCIITIYCYWYGLPLWSHIPHPVTYVCILFSQEVMSQGLYFSILTILMQSLSLGHVLTITPSI